MIKSLSRILWFSFLLIAAQVMAQTQLPVAVDRPMAAAGKFYPADPDELRNTLKGLFKAAAKRSVKNVQAIIVPHAGYQFSGKVAASSFNQIDPEHEYENIFIIGSSHSQLFEGASVYNTGDYLTPLGKVVVNRELAAKLLAENSVFSYNPAADENEHAIEVEIPFLQYHMKKPFRIVPIIIGTQSEETCKKIARALLPWFNEKNLFIISSDFSHYPSSTDATTVDRSTADVILANSPPAFLETIRQESLKKVPDLATAACGWTSILTLLYLTSPEPGFKYQPVLYRNSGDVPGTAKTNVVGYWSIAVLRTTTDNSTGWIQPDQEDKQKMLGLARSALEEYLKSGRPVQYKMASATPLMQKHYGAFVTLTKQGQLRGCIGRMTSDEPLYQLIPEIVVASAIEDPRFRPVSSSELNDIQIEISILSPLKKVNGPEEVIVGKHGVLIRKNGHEGTLLPQVGRENHWTREELLGFCSLEKAGLGWDGWKDADIFIYEAVEFSEKSTGSKD